MTQDKKVIDAGFVQRREWMLYRVRYDHYPCNNFIKFDMPSFDECLFQKVIRRVIEKHEILRTTLNLEKGALRQTIHPSGRFDLDLMRWDISNMTEVQKRDFIERKIEIGNHAPFNFELGPLFRSIVFKKSHNSYAIYFIIHHLVCDDHSLQLFTEDLNSAFIAVSSGVEMRDPGIHPVHYSEYSQLENELLDTEKGDKYRRYWQDILQTGLPRLEIIHKDKWEKHQQSYLVKVEEVKKRGTGIPGFDERFIPSVIRRYRTVDGGKVVIRYDEPTYLRIKSYEQEGRGSLLTLLVGSLVLALHRLSGQIRFAFDIPAYSRVSRKFEKTMGWLSAGGPCFLDIDANQPTAGLTTYIDEQLFLLSKNCIYPFETLGYHLISPTGSRMPAFLNLSYIKEDREDEETGIIQNSNQGHPTYENIAFFFSAFNNALLLEVYYNNQLFDPEQITGIIHEQVTCLTEMIRELNDKDERSRTSMTKMKDPGPQ